MNWKLFVVLGLPLLAGCTIGPLAGGTSPAGPIQTFILDFARQALAAFAL